ncbi:MAG: aerolysin family beta-barrel pore-forming toxin [Mucilaginibacter sp.]|uniref:aerolysin family beta-barrel pore-forming toxin n=1 Tax=Mucilaginibacter sp. TaxID=1882438 RepID=UPI003267281A
MGDVNATDYMNQLLELKSKVRYSGTQIKSIWVFTDKDGKHINKPSEPVEIEVPYDYVGSAKVVNSRIVRVTDLIFDKTRITTLPQSGILTRKTIINCADASVTSTIGLSVTGTKSWSVTKTDSVSTTVGASISGSVGVPGVAGGSASLSFSQQISTSNAVTDGGSDQVTRSSNENISVGPRRAISIELFAYQSGAEIPYSANVVIDGDLQANDSGLSVASSLLSEKERTLQISGILRLTDVSEANLRTRDIGGAEGCEAPMGITISEDRFSSFPAEKLGSYFAEDFVNSASAVRKDGQLFAHSTKFADFSWTITEGGPQIGPPDGTHYEILYTTQITEATPSCGFNDLGLMNLGLFNVEVRQYRTYVGGKAAAEWQESVKTFVLCFPF